jgi:hypothetical protein
VFSQRHGLRCISKSEQELVAQEIDSHSGVGGEKYILSTVECKMGMEEEQEMQWEKPQGLQTPVGSLPSNL